MPEEKDETKETPTDDENFGSAFDEAAITVETPDETINLEEAPPKPAEGPPKVEEPVVPPKEEPPVVETPGTEPTKPAVPAPDVARLLADLQTKLDAQAAEILELKKAPPKAAEPPAETPPVEEVDEEVKSFEEEYDYLAKPVKKIVDKMVKGAIAAQGQPGPGLDEETTKRLIADGIHFGIINSRHGDFFDLQKSGELERFAQTDPQLKKIYESGTTEEVIGLVDKFKAAKNPPPAAPPTVDPVKDQKLHDLEAVRNRRAPIDAAKGTGKAETFDDAFAERAAALDSK